MTGRRRKAPEPGRISVFIRQCRAAIRRRRVERFHRVPRFDFPAPFSYGRIFWFRVAFRNRPYE